MYIRIYSRLRHMNAKVRRPYKMAASHNNNKVLATNLATLCNIMKVALLASVPQAT